MSYNKRSVRELVNAFNKRAKGEDEIKSSVKVPCENKKKCNLPQKVSESNVAVQKDRKNHSYVEIEDDQGPTMQSKGGNNKCKTTKIGFNVNPLSRLTRPRRDSFYKNDRKTAFVKTHSPELQNNTEADELSDGKISNDSSETDKQTCGNLRANDFRTKIIKEIISKCDQEVIAYFLESDKRKDADEEDHKINNLVAHLLKKGPEEKEEEEDDEDIPFPKKEPGKEQKENASERRDVKFTPTLDHDRVYCNADYKAPGVSASSSDEHIYEEIYEETDAKVDVRSANKGQGDLMDEMKQFLTRSLNIGNGPSALYNGMGKGAISKNPELRQLPNDLVKPSLPPKQFRISATPEREAINAPGRSEAADANDETSDLMESSQSSFSSTEGKRLLASMENKDIQFLDDNVYEDIEKVDPEKHKKLPAEHSSKGALRRCKSALPSYSFWNSNGRVRPEGLDRVEHNPASKEFREM